MNTYKLVFACYFGSFAIGAAIVSPTILIIPALHALIVGPLIYEVQKATS